MTKKLFLIRHGKSDWGDAGLKDFDRPLNSRGKANATEMAKRLVNQQLFPDLIVSSPAKRALSTAKYFAKEWDIDENHIQLDVNIYEAGLKTLLKAINDFNNEQDIVAIFGHNPGFTDLANYLSSGHIYNMPTSSIVYLEFPFDDWKLISNDTAKVVLFDYPKSLDD